MTYAEKITAILRARDITAPQLAELTEIPYQTIAAILSGRNATMRSLRNREALDRLYFQAVVQ